MDSNNLKYILLLFCVVVGQFRESLAVGCFSGADCDVGEYCNHAFQCQREIILDPDYISYHRQQSQDRDHNFNEYPQSFNDRREITLGQEDDSEWMNENEYEIEREERNLGLNAPLINGDTHHDKITFHEDHGSLPPGVPVNRDEIDNKNNGNLRYDKRNQKTADYGVRHRQDSTFHEDHGPLPPEDLVNWDKINNKNNGNLRSDKRNQKSVDSDSYDNFKARRHIRHRQDSISSDSVGRRYDTHDSFQDSKEVVENKEKFEDSHGAAKPNLARSSKKSSVFNSEVSGGKRSEEKSADAKSFTDEKKIPPVPLASEGGSMLEDNSHLQGNQLLTEKAAFVEEAAADAKVAAGKVMVKGKVQQVKADIDQGPNPEKTYKRVEDFFQSQRESSIVEVPNSVKKEEASKLFKENFIPVKEDGSDQINKEQADSSLHKDGEIKLSLNKKVQDSNIHVKMAQTKYTLEKPEDVAERIKKEPSVKSDVAQNSGLEIVSADFEDASNKDVKGNPQRSVKTQQPKYFLVTIIVVGCVTGVILTAVAIYLIMRRHNEANFKPVTLPGQEAAADYQELCRQLRATQGWDSAPVKTTSLQHGEKEKGLGSGRAPKYSWSEEPVVPNMDISTGHVVLSYMEDHLNNKDRLNKEWEALKTYEAEPNSREVGKLEKNARKNRYSDVLPYDHNRVLLKETASATGSDYINASYITDHDPKNPTYIATQGPVAHTVSDFWQMVWEQGVVVIVNLTKLSDLGLPQCHRYWPEEQQPIVKYRIYEVHLVSEHIWCEDYLVRSFYLKNLQTSETRTVTQFHFLTWPDLNVPSTPKPLLEFRRKVNKCFRGRASPVMVHCSGGVGRTGTYILIDMVLNKMMRGAKEIDIAATVEHLRDQRPSMVKTKAQFEFALTAVAEEVNAILQALAK
ncbi:receptor-type tyrosine-protein phosphatase N2-like isoform X2 [Stylophora pistillata]|uniref:Receptor-type tyrosine-protein phosphatase N2 n=1 Tax=Stylophora pistillata TaxID=50429 RepID=A0A2B4SE00_STYPI|nr:receptor-type tyrosine-protein phosphatase N2-like isoform X2 [Stylophora pistillata]PFX26762.1 Receptor-type tyrosine-protein phosphatase N2 [Stylophora pistillata]